MTVPSSAPPSTSSSPSRKSLNWLTDIRFNNFITQWIVSVLYLLSLVGVGLFAVWYWTITLLDARDAGDGTGALAFLALWTAPLIVFVALLLTLLIRLAFESIMVRFRIAEDLRHIRDK